MHRIEFASTVVVRLICCCAAHSRRGVCLTLVCVRFAGWAVVARCGGRCGIETATNVRHAGAQPTDRALRALPCSLATSARCILEAQSPPSPMPMVHRIAEAPHGLQHGLQHDLQHLTDVASDVHDDGHHHHDECNAPHSDTPISSRAPPRFYIGIDETCPACPELGAENEKRPASASSSSSSSGGASAASGAASGAASTTAGNTTTATAEAPTPSVARILALCGGNVLAERRLPAPPAALAFVHFGESVSGVSDHPSLSLSTERPDPTTATRDGSAAAPAAPPGGGGGGAPPALESGGLGDALVVRYDRARGQGGGSSLQLLHCPPVPRVAGLRGNSLDNTQSGGGGGVHGVDGRLDGRLDGRPPSLELVATFHGVAADGVSYLVRDERPIRSAPLAQRWPSVGPVAFRDGEPSLFLL